MRTDVFNLAFAYLRLSDDEKEGKSESASISNQRMMIQKYCEQHGIILVDEFVDDGWSGGNFDRPAFQRMLQQLKLGKANMVITKAAMPEVPILIDAACVASNDDALDEAALKVMESMHVKVQR